MAGRPRWQPCPPARVDQDEQRKPEQPPRCGDPSRSRPGLRRHERATSDAQKARQAARVDGSHPALARAGYRRLGRWPRSTSGSFRSGPRRRNSGAPPSARGALPARDGDLDGLRVDLHREATPPGLLGGDQRRPGPGEAGGSAWAGVSRVAGRRSGSRRVLLGQVELGPHRHRPGCDGDWDPPTATGGLLTAGRGVRSFAPRRRR